MTGTCGKVTLCGEHFVLFGAPALALPWTGGRLFLVRSAGVPDAADDDRLEAAWNRAREAAGLAAGRGFPFEVRSTIPRGAGLGSSAALSVELVRAAFAEAGRDVTAAALIRAATEVEAVFHGRSSGLDPAAALLGRPVLREASGDLRPVSWRLESFDLLLALAPGARRTDEAVARSRAFAVGHPDRFAALLEEAAGLVREVATLLSGGTGPGAAARLGARLTRNHAMLVEIGVSTPGLDGLVAAARSAGALGAKLCGAGLGGVVLAAVPPGTADGVGRALEAAGAHRVLPFPLPVAEASP